MAVDLGYEVPAELAGEVYQLVEKARTGGKLRVGSNEVTKSVERGEAKLVVIAGDVNPVEIIMHLPVICAEKNIPIISVNAKEELGASAGLPVGTAAVAIVDAGQGKTQMSKIAKNIEALKGGKPVSESPAEEKKE